MAAPPPNAFEAVVGTLHGEPLRASFPLRATVFGVAAVRIPEVDYLALLSARNAAPLLAARAALLRPREPRRARLPYTIDRSRLGSPTPDTAQDSARDDQPNL